MRRLIYFLWFFVMRKFKCFRANNNLFGDKTNIILALTVWNRQYLEDSEQKDHLLNELNTDHSKTLECIYLREEVGKTGAKIF